MAPLDPPRGPSGVRGPRLTNPGLTIKPFLLADVLFDLVRSSRIFQRAENKKSSSARPDKVDEEGDGDLQEFGNHGDRIYFDNA